MKRKRCFKCGKTRTLSMFYKHPMMADGHLGKCKDCTKKDVAEHRAANIERVHAYDNARFKSPERKAQVLECARRRKQNRPGRVKAGNKVANAIRDGKIVRGPCEVCGTTERVQAHHDDYRRPLVVRWLCFKHHREHHGQTVTSTF